MSNQIQAKEQLTMEQSAMEQHETASGSEERNKNLGPGGPCGKFDWEKFATPVSFGDIRKRVGPGEDVLPPKPFYISPTSFSVPLDGTSLSNAVNGINAKVTTVFERLYSIPLLGSLPCLVWEFDFQDKYWRVDYFNPFTQARAVINVHMFWDFFNNKIIVECNKLRGDSILAMILYNELRKEFDFDFFATTSSVYKDVTDREATQGLIQQSIYFASEKSLDARCIAAEFLCISAFDRYGVESFIYLDVWKTLNSLFRFFADIRKLTSDAFLFLAFTFAKLSEYSECCEFIGKLEIFSLLFILHTDVEDELYSLHARRAFTYVAMNVCIHKTELVIGTVGELTLTIWLHDRHTVSDPIIKECLERAYHVFRDYPGFLEA